MSRLYVDKVNANTTNGDVTLETNLIVSGNLNVTGIFDAHVSDFKVSANQMILGDESSDVVTFKAATASIPNNLSFTTGSVAVGTTTFVAPSGVAKYVLVSDPSSAGISLNDTGGTQWDVYSADGRLNFFASANGAGVANRMAILHDGQVGIGTIAPSTLLEVAGDVKVSGANKLYLFDSGGEYLSSDGTDLTIAAGTAINIVAGVLDLSAQTVDVTLNAAVDALNFDSNTLSIDASNNRVGIGTAAPAMPLHVVNSAGGRIMLHRSSGDSSSQLGGILFGANDGDTNLAMITAYQDGAADAAYISFETEATGGSMAERLRITSAGNVGIGVADPDELLEVAGDVKVSGANKLYFYDSGGEHISANSSGVLSIAAGSEVDITATTIDMNGNVDISGNALVSGEVQTANIGYTDGDNAMTIADGGAVTFPQAAVFSSGFSAGDANITNVGDIALDSISSDAGTSISITLGTDAGDDLIVATNALVVEGDNKNIGVGTTTPTSDAGIAKFIEVSDASSAGIVLNDTGGRKWNIWSADGKLKVWNGTDGDVLTLWGTDVGIGTATPAKRFDVNGDARIGDDLFLQSDAAVLNFGTNDDVSLTHVHDTGLLLNSSRQLQFGDSGTYIHQSADGVLDLVADTEIEINATTVDINGAADISGNLVVGGNLTVSGTTTTVDVEVVNTANGVIFEGATDNTVETTLKAVDPTSSDKTIQLPDASGFVALLTTAATDTIDATPAEINAACDASGRTAAAVAVADDHFLICDGAATGATKVESLADYATAIAGTGIAASSGVLSLDAAQTVITSLLATDIKIGEDDETKIDFETANEIHFYAANAEQVYVADGILGPQTDSDVDLGSSTHRFKDAYVDSVSATGAIGSGTTLTAGTDLTVTGGDIIFGNGQNATIDVADVSGTNTAGKKLTIIGGAGTGNATPGSVDLNVTTAGSSGATVQTHRTVLSAHHTGVTVQDTLTITGVNADTSGALKIYGGDDDGALVWLLADQGDDAGDEWQISIPATTQVLTFGNDKASAGTSTTQFSYTPHATATSGYLSLAGSLKVGSNIIQNSEGTTTITMDTSENITVAGGVVAGAASTFNADVSLGENNITNVGDINCDSISVDGAATGLNLDFSGANTGTGKVTLADNLASALTFTEGSNPYMTFVTTDSSEVVMFTEDVQITDDDKLYFGTNKDWSIEYDEDGGDDLVLTGSDISIESSTSAKPVMQLLNTNDDALGSTFKFNKNGSSVGDGDVIGNLDFVSEDDGAAEHTYAKMIGSIDVDAAGEESGKLQLQVASHDGGVEDGLVLVGGSADTEVDVTIGKGTASVTTVAGVLNVTSGIEVTTKESLTATSASATASGTVTGNTRAGSITVTIQASHTFANGSAFSVPLSNSLIDADSVIVCSMSAISAVDGSGTNLPTALAPAVVAQADNGCSLSVMNNSGNSLNDGGGMSFVINYLIM